MSNYALDISEELEKPELDAMLRKFASCDWGHVPEEVWLRNDEYYKSGNGCIQAEYRTENGALYEVSRNEKGKISIRECVPF